jgi:hypothetical protein
MTQIYYYTVLLLDILSTYFGISSTISDGGPWLAHSTALVLHIDGCQHRGQGHGSIQARRRRTDLPNVASS